MHRARLIRLALVGFLTISGLLPASTAAAQPQGPERAAGRDEEDTWSGKVTFEQTYQVSRDDNVGGLQITEDWTTVVKHTFTLIPETTYLKPSSGQGQIRYYVDVDWSGSYDKDYFHRKRAPRCSVNAGQGVTEGGGAADNDGDSSIFISSIDGGKTFDLHPGSSDEPRERHRITGASHYTYLDCTGAGFSYDEEIDESEHHPGVLDVSFDRDQKNRIFGEKTDIRTGPHGGGSWVQTTRITWDLIRGGCSEDDLSGPHWRERFPDSKSTKDLTPKFGPAVDRFLAALRSAGAHVSIGSTYRPPERAYLMHYAWQIARKRLDPARVPKMDGVKICWVHPDPQASRKAAEDMVDAYNIVYQPSLKSLHTQRRAIDMTITWQGTLEIKDGKGKVVTIDSEPRNGGDNKELWAVGKSYKVRKLAKDAPHWSDSGR